MNHLKYYAVANGRKIGIFDNWKECNEQVYEFPKNKFKSFENYKEAIDYLKINNVDINNIVDVTKKNNLITNYFKKINKDVNKNNNE